MFRHIFVSWLVGVPTKHSDTSLTSSAINHPTNKPAQEKGKHFFAVRCSGATVNVYSLFRARKRWQTSTHSVFRHTHKRVGLFLTLLICWLDNNKWPQWCRYTAGQLFFALPGRKVDQLMPLNEWMNKWMDALLYLLKLVFVLFLFLSTTKLHISSRLFPLLPPPPPPSSSAVF